MGAVLAALPFFADRLATVKEWRKPENFSYFLKLGVAFGVTVIGALAFKKLGLPKTVKPVAMAILIGGALFVIVERWLVGRKATEDITWTVAIVIGLAQVLAVVFPGTSRSGATILLALMLGLSRGAAVEFSFLLGVPTLCAAGAKTMLDAYKAHELDLIQWGPLIVATVAASIASVLAVRWLLGYVRNHTFVGFGWYRIGLAMVILVIHLAFGQ